ncbi:MAG TPA: redoxin domain-containing protein [Pirellulaceae bacterium]
MKSILAVLLTAITATAASAADQVVASFTLADFRGKQHQLSDFSDQKLIVVAFLGTECPLAKLYGPKLAKLADEYSSRGVAFIGINANQQDSLTEIAAYARQHGIEFPLLKDLENKVADQFSAQRTPEVFVLDANRAIRYRGRIDDQWGIGYVKDQPQHNELKTALDELLAGKAVTVTKTDAVGCLIGRVRKQPATGTVTYADHIAPLFNKRCVQCHRAGDIGPFSLTSYDEAVGWAPMIEEVVDQGRMPPWHANPQYGHFADERRLTEDEKTLIRDWVAGGAPAGDLVKAPTPPEFVSGWQMSRQPDLVIKMRPQPFEVPAAGEVRYQFFLVDPGFTEDKWVEASEVLPGNRAVVHHILVFARGGAGGERAEQLREGTGGGFLSAFVPGMRAKPFPSGMAKRIPAGSKIIFQVHYTPNGTKQLDNSQLGLWFTDAKNVTHEVKTIANATRRLEIPPYDSNYKAEVTTGPLPVEGLLLSMAPHMHLRGKDFRYDVILPGSSDKTLLDVPHYDFNWQTTYRLAEPLKLPRGTRMHSVAHYDNSADNLSNPDASQTVRWGDQTWDEMMIGYFDIAIPRTEADKVPVEAGSDAQPPRTASETPRLDGPALLLLLDKNSDGKISRAEAPQRLKNAFDLLDRNQDGELDAAELARIPQGGRQ